MNNYEYVILFDENGQPYIAHSVWSRVKSGAKAAGKTAHKYLLKVGEGAKARYAYTKEEVDALMGRGRQAAKETAADIKYKTRKIFGVAEKEAVERAREKRKDALKIEGIKEASRQAYRDAETMLKDANNAEDKRMASVEKRIASREYSEKDLRKAEDAYAAAKEEYNKAKERFSKAPIGLFTAGRFKDALKVVDSILKDDHMSRIPSREKYITENTSGSLRTRGPVSETELGDTMASGGSVKDAKDLARVRTQLREGYKAYKEREEAFKKYDDARLKAKLARGEADRYEQVAMDNLFDTMSGTPTHDQNWMIGIQMAYDKAAETAEKLEKEAEKYHELFIQAQDRYGAISQQSKEDEEIYRRIGLIK